MAHFGIQKEACCCCKDLKHICQMLPVESPCFSKQLIMYREEGEALKKSLFLSL